MLRSDQGLQSTLTGARGTTRAKSGFKKRTRASQRHAFCSKYHARHRQTWHGQAACHAKRLSAVGGELLRMGHELQVHHENPTTTTTN